EVVFISVGEGVEKSPVFAEAVGLIRMGNHAVADHALNNASNAGAKKIFFVIPRMRNPPLFNPWILELIHVLGVGLLRQSAHFKNQRRLFIALINDLRVGCFAVIDVAEASAEADDKRREFHLAEEPTRDVHLV